MKWKSEEDKWGDGGKKDKSVESAEEKAEEGEEKALAAASLLQPPESNFYNSDNNGTNPH